LRALGRMGMVTEADRSVVTPLLPFRLPVTVTEALETLRATIEPYQLLALYKHYFPTEYERAKPGSSSRTKRYTAQASMSSFALVNECLFPLAYWFMDMTEADFAEMGDGDPERDVISRFGPLAIDPEENYFGELSLGLRFVLALSGMDRPGKGDDYGFEPELVEDMWELPMADGNMIQELLRRCEEIPEPLKSLPEAIAYVWKETGNPWLDAYEDTALGPTIQQDWSREGVDWLLEHFDAATGIKRRVEALFEWLEESFENRCEALLLYSDCVGDLGEAANRGVHEWLRQRARLVTCERVFEMVTTMTKRPARRIGSQRGIPRILPWGFST
jgi:hypothetical protein